MDKCSNHNALLNSPGSSRSSSSSLTVPQWGEGFPCSSPAGGCQAPFPPCVKRSSSRPQMLRLPAGNNKKAPPQLQFSAQMLPPFRSGSLARQCARYRVRGDGWMDAVGWRLSEALEWSERVSLLLSARDQHAHTWCESAMQRPSMELQGDKREQRGVCCSLQWRC